MVLPSAFGSIQDLPILMSGQLYCSYTVVILYLKTVGRCTLIWFVYWITLGNGSSGIQLFLTENYFNLNAFTTSWSTEFKVKNLLLFILLFEIIESEIQLKKLKVKKSLSSWWLACFIQDASSLNIPTTTIRLLKWTNFKVILLNNKILKFSIRNHSMWVISWANNRV